MTPVRLGLPAATALSVRIPLSVDEALRDVEEWPAGLLPGHGATVQLWELLATLAAGDLAVARAVEPHLDALAILDQARTAGMDQSGLPFSTWGVFAAETPTARLRATRAPGESWRLDGLKPWCSLAGRLDGALVTAALPGEGDDHGLFVVDLHSPGVEPVRHAWISRGLREIPSGPVRFDDVAAELVRDGDWYVQRPGFWWGGIGVAACWYGGAVGIARRVLLEARRRPDDRLLAMHLGSIDERLASARYALAHAAAAVDSSGSTTDGGRTAGSAADRSAGRVLAKRVRAVVARTCEAVLASSGHALGPGPLTQEEDHAKRVVDLEIYLRQHHAERDDASLGNALTASEGDPW
ncbi:acyl-CoA dehydrogenase family protein [Cellulomonas sp. P5_E12]